MKHKLAVLSILAAAGAVPSAAWATPPEREPVPAVAAVFPAGMYCDFPVQLDPLRVGEKLTIFSDGRARVTGAAIIRLTNTDNGRSIVVNSSGPSWLDRNVGEGPQLFFMTAEDVLGRGIYLFHGRVKFTRDDQGFFNSLSFTGHPSGNLCNAIA